MIKGSICQEYITISNIGTPNNSAPRRMKHKLPRLKGETNNLIILIGDFNPPLSKINKRTKQKINKEIKDLNNYIQTRRERHLENTPNSKKIYIHLRYTWNIHHDRAHSRL